MQTKKVRNLKIRPWVNDAWNVDYVQEALSILDNKLAALKTSVSLMNNQKAQIMEISKSIQNDRKRKEQNPVANGRGCKTSWR